MQDLTFLKIDQLIIHELPRHGEKAGVLSDAVTPLTDQVRHFFEERIRGSLRDAGLPIGFVTGHQSPVPAEVSKVLDGSKLPGASALSKGKQPPENTFVDSSRAIASHLFSIQNSVHSEGLIGLATCTLKSARALAIIKLELEEGVRAKLQGTKGSQHFEIEVLTDLMLTRNTRVFKVALFATEPGRYLEALVCDSQRPRGELIAEYFLNTFLGCELLEKPEVATKTFVDAAEAFFNKAIQDPTARSRYHTALLAELGSNHTTIRSKAFAESHLDNTDRAPFLSALKDAGVPPAFPKHTGLVKNRIGRTRLDFDGDVSVSMPPDALNKSVSLENIADGRTRLQLEAHLESVRGAK